MSRIRIVGGKIVKNTVGEHSIFSKGNIILNAKGRIIQEGKENGVHFGEPKPAPSSATCAVYFYPHKNWQGEFGMDWLRDGESKMMTDVRYNEIVGKYGDVYATSKGAKFTPQHTSGYIPLTNEYKKFLFTDKILGTYHIPYVTLYTDNTANFDIRSHIIEAPDSMEYRYNKNIFDLTILKKVTKTKGINYYNTALRITCKRPFNFKEYGYLSS